LKTNTASEKVFTTLRIAAACCFIGHGAFGIITKAIWCNYFAVFGIGQEMAYKLMPWLGSFDIALGLLFLVFPLRIIAAWLVLWGFFTALLRPLSGEPVAEWIERAGNYGVPFTMLVLTGGIASWSSLFKPLKLSTATNDICLQKAFTCLKVITFLLLLGHGWLNLIEKKGLLSQYASIGFPQPRTVALWVGLFEISAALSVLIRPLRSLIFIFFIWKMMTELFYPHFEIFEWVERAGSFGALLSLWFVLGETGITSSTRSFLAWRKKTKAALS